MPHQGSESVFGPLDPVSGIIITKKKGTKNYIVTLIGIRGNFGLTIRAMRLDFLRVYILLKVWDTNHPFGF